MKKNILFIIPTLCGGGAEKTVANLSLYLKKDYNITIVNFIEEEEKYEYSGDLLFLSTKKEKNVFEKIAFFITSIFKLRKIKKERNIDYAISFLTGADMLNVLSKTKNSKTLISIRNTDSILNNNLKDKFKTKYSCKKCDHIIAISKQVKDDLIESFKIPGEKIAVIYNPSIRIEFGKSELQVPENFFKNNVIINVGRLSEQKGQYHLIKAFSLVVDSIPDAKLIILGKGPLEDLIHDTIDYYKLNDSVVLLGFVNNPYDYITRSKCFVFSSLFEGLGNALMEALSCNIAAISTDCVSGPREILAPDTDYKKKVTDKIEYAKYGVLVPVCNSNNDFETITNEEKLMAKAIIDMLSDEKKIEKYKKAALQRSKDFDINNITNEWEELLTSIDKKRSNKE